MEPAGSLPCWKVILACHYPKPNKSNLHDFLSNFFKIQFNGIFHTYCLSVCLSLSLSLSLYTHTHTITLWWGENEVTIDKGHIDCKGSKTLI